MWPEAVGERGLLFFPVNIEDKTGDAEGSDVWDRWCGYSDNTGTVETVWGMEHPTACVAVAPLYEQANVPK